MGFLSVFDIIGPVMVGPSSSHTAGAAKIGFELHKLLQGKLKKVEITLFNSFADTGEGHGTKTAVLGGILGLTPENGLLKKSFEIARQNGVKFVFANAYDGKRHPNSVQIICRTVCGVFSCFGESLGGGLIEFTPVQLGVLANA